MQNTRARKGKKKKHNNTPMNLFIELHISRASSHYCAKTPSVNDTHNKQQDSHFLPGHLLGMPIDNLCDTVVAS